MRLSSKSIAEFNTDRRWPIRVQFDLVHSRKRGSGATTLLVARTPAFAATLDEINAVSSDTPVFVLHLYDRALLNAAALRACGYTKATPDPPGGEIQRDKQGNPTGILIARPNAMILYSTLARGPKLPPEYQRNSTRHFMRELNRLGITSAIDAGARQILSDAQLSASETAFRRTRARMFRDAINANPPPAK